MIPEDFSFEVIVSSFWSSAVKKMKNKVVRSGGKVEEVQIEIADLDFKIL